MTQPRSVVYIDGITMNVQWIIDDCFMTCCSIMIVIGCGYDLPGMPYACWNIIQYLQESNSLEKQ